MSSVAPLPRPSSSATSPSPPPRTPSGLPSPTLEMSPPFVLSSSSPSRARLVLTLHFSHKKVRLPTDNETGRPKGFGYVEFSSLDAAIAAVTKGGPTATGDGVNIEGRTVRLDYSQPRADRAPGGDRGGRGVSWPFFLCSGIP